MPESLAMPKQFAAPASSTRILVNDFYSAMFLRQDGALSPRSDGPLPLPLLRRRQRAGLEERNLSRACDVG